MKHEITVQRTATGITGDCSCGAGVESMGHDESSRSSVAAWKAEHVRSIETKEPGA